MENLVDGPREVQVAGGYPPMTISMLSISQQRMAASWGPAVIKFLLFAAIGIELMALAAWLPDTLGRWISPNAAGISDFTVFYNNAESANAVGMYSSGLVLLMRPLTWLNLTAAYQVYFAINASALLAVAYLAQRPVQRPEAKVAVFLAVMALPQAHWALRTGHFIPVLALLALSGFLLAERRPVIAGICFGLLALKPQYLPIPILFLLWTRNWRALAGAAGSLVVLSGVGMAFIGPDAFFSQLDRMMNVSLDQSQVYLPVQQTWQYSWQGFLLSAGIEPTPVFTIYLIGLSLGIAMVAWTTGTPSVVKVAAALAMLLVAPYSSFYNWSMIAVAGALLLRSDLRPKALIPILLAMGVLAAAVTQKATPYPTLEVLGLDVVARGGTYGLYWLPPFALGTLVLLAFAGRRRPEQVSEPAAPAKKKAKRGRRKPQPQAANLGHREPRLAMGAALAVIGLTSGYLLSAYVSNNEPFRQDPFGRQTVLQALPDDFPLPDSGVVERAGRGTLLPYRVEWVSDRPVSEVAGVIGRKIEEGPWELVLVEDHDGVMRLQTVRLDPGGYMDMFAELQVSDIDGGSVMSLEFTPMPTKNVAGLDDWLGNRGTTP